MIVENMLLYTFGCQYLYMIFYLCFYTIGAANYKKHTKKLGETTKVVAEGESLNIVSEF